MSETGPIYFDCNASPPMDPRVQVAVSQWMLELPGNPSAVLHHHGKHAAELVAFARGQVARSARVQSSEIVFTSGATESNNLALLGLMAHGMATGKRHIITSNVEHSSILGVCTHLEKLGFRHETVKVNEAGAVTCADVAHALREDTLLVSLMAANNVTGICQPVAEVADLLTKRDIFFHVDAAQGFGRMGTHLHHPGIDLMSISGHKLYGPKGVGALIVREGVPLQPLMFGGGQQERLRPGTLPTALIAGLGLAVEQCEKEAAARAKSCAVLGEKLRTCLAPFQPVYFGDQSACLPHVCCVALPGVDAALAIALLANQISLSRGSACTSGITGPSHVVTAMTKNAQLQDAALRFSWYHATPEPNWQRLHATLASII